MPGVVGELGEERPLGAAVALAERVQGVDVSEELRDQRYRGSVRGSPKWGKTLLSENQVMAQIWSPRRVRTIIP